MSATDQCIHGMPLGSCPLCNSHPTNLEADGLRSLLGETLGKLAQAQVDLKAKAQEIERLQEDVNMVMHVLPAEHQPDREHTLAEAVESALHEKDRVIERLRHAVVDESEDAEELAARVKSLKAHRDATLADAKAQRERADNAEETAAHWKWQSNLNLALLVNERERAEVLKGLVERGVELIGLRPPDHCLPDLKCDHCQWNADAEAALAADAPTEKETM